VTLFLLPLLLVLSGSSLRASAAELLANGGFENGLTGWSAFWSRDTGTGQATIDTTSPHAGKTALRVEHTGDRDWCVNSGQPINVVPGEIYRLEGWARLSAEGSVVLAVETVDAGGKALDWSFAARTASEAGDWRPLRSRFVAPEGVAKILPRILGNGPVTAWIDAVSLQKEGQVAGPAAGQPTTLSLSNATLAVTLKTADGTLSVLDRRNGHTWQQQVATRDVLIRGDALTKDGLKLDLLHVGSGLDLRSNLRLADGPNPELLVTLEGDGDLPGAVQFPQPFVTSPGTYLVVPMNEGISYPVEDASIERFRLIAYGGHGICMGFWGATDGTNGHMAILETPDDAAIRIDRVAGRLCIAPEWDPQKGRLGYARRLRYVFFDRGGHAAMAKRYREFARSTGLLKTLAEKRQSSPNVDLLIGAVNVWCWDKDAPGIAGELQAAGIDRILWSNRQPPENLKKLNEMGVLTSRYDIYQDAMDPANFKYLRGRHADWTSEGWPKDMMVGPRGDWIRGWGVKGTNDQWYYCGVLCDKLAPAYAAKRMPAELVNSPYRCRFIDTTTASPWRECYAPDHPLTRSESRQWKMRLLEYVSKDLNLVCGCETGHEAAVPFVHYFEGMLSLGPYRVPDAGRDMRRIWTEVPERVRKFQVGWQYRLPLWELVYHDCVVAQWYWGDYNNKLPAVWDLRDLFNVLYGTPPMFMFDRKLWQQDKARFVQSYRNSGPLVRRVGYEPMTDHRFLTPDRRVQQTVFGNVVTVTVNFGEEAVAVGGVTIPARGFRVEGDAKP
jgi:hypothetical protein